MRTKLQRIHVSSRKTNNALSRNHTGPSQTGPGPAHAPRNSSAPRNDVPSTCAYSESWIIANFIPEYSTRNPATSSDSASRMSKGTRFSAATAVMMKKTKAIWPMTGYAMNHRPDCAAAISDIRSDPASITGTSADMMNGRSYEMIWFTARIADSSAYLLFEPQPAMNSPTISMADTARKNRMPMLTSATPRPGANGMVAKINMHGMRNTIGARL